MPLNYLHVHPEFEGLIRAVAEAKGIAPDLVEKDYWIMHCLYGLQSQGYQFELKGGTSLSKGFGVIQRFSEDIDIRIEPRDDSVFVGKNQDKAKHCDSRKQFYNRLAAEIAIPGISDVVRDEEFDDVKFRSGGIRLKYESINPVSSGLKEGILLEVGFDTVAPNLPVTISSWALDFALLNKMEVIDSKAVNVACYHPGYTLVEKLQTISTKFRRQQELGNMPSNFMRHYYDVHCLLKNKAVQSFIGTEEYIRHKDMRFPEIDKAIPIQENQAFLLSDENTRKLYQKSYEGTSGLYYQEQPEFDTILKNIQKALSDL